MHLGHAGQPCPSIVVSDEEAGPDSRDFGQSSTSGDTVFGNGLPKLKGPDFHVVVDRSGVHQLRIIPCGCANAPKDEERYTHYLAMGLFHASIKKVKTVFTFGVLDDFRMDNLECKTAGLNYWHKIVRITLNEFPKSVPVIILVLYGH
jgi:hypothetical protein